MRPNRPLTRLEQRLHQRNKDLFQQMVRALVDMTHEVLCPDCLKRFGEGLERLHEKAVEEEKRSQA